MTTPRPATTERVWLGLTEATSYTGLSKRTLQKAIYDGLLQTSQATPNGTHRIHRDWLDEYMISRGKATRRAGRARKAAS